MPIKALFPRSNRKSVWISDKLLEVIRQDCKRTNLTLGEAINYALAQRFAPDLIKEFDDFRANTKFRFPNRKTGNRYTVKK